MAFPDNLVITHSFNNDLDATGLVDKAKLDEVLAEIVTSYNDLLTLVKTIMREDGVLRDEIVRLYNIDPAVFV